MKTSNPRPPAPITEAIITAFSESMITWLTPTKSVGRAEGIITFHVSCRGEQPAMRPNSTISGETSLNPNMVARTIGGVA